MTKIKVNPTQVTDHKSHPVFLVTRKFHLEIHNINISMESRDNSLVVHGGQPVANSPVALLHLTSWAWPAVVPAYAVGSMQV